MCFVDKVRTYAKSMPIEQAVDRAITECIKDDVLVDFLRKNRAEVKDVSIYEYNEEEHMNLVREEGMQYGIAKGELCGKAEAADRMMEELNLTMEDAFRIAGISSEQYQMVKDSK